MDNDNTTHKSVITMLVLAFIIIISILFLIFSNITESKNQKAENYTGSLQRMLNEPLQEMPKALVSDDPADLKTSAGQDTLYYLTNQRKVLDTYLPTLIETLEKENLSLNGFNNLTKPEQEEVVTILENSIPNLSWYNLEPYITTQEKFDAYNKIHYLNVEARNEPKMVLANAYGDQMKGINLTESGETWEATYNPDHWTFNTVTQPLNSENILYFSTIKDVKTHRWLIKLEDISTSPKDNVTEYEENVESTLTKD